MKPRLFVLWTLCVLASVRAATIDEQTVVPVWPGEPPGSEGKSGDENVRITPSGERVVSSVHRPTLTVFLPHETHPTAAVVIVPGGGHRELWMDHEGYNVAEWLAKRGVAAFVLKYRLAREAGSTYGVEQESLADVQRAIRLVRARAAEWHVDPARVGVMGFSAGGELAALAAVRAADGPRDSSDKVGEMDARPAFQALIYPGRSDAIAPKPENPPAFLLCGAKDRPDISEGLARVYLRFKEAQVSAELHIYAHAGHGFGLRASDRSPTASWLDRFHDWLSSSGFVDAR